jgi:hypothetical protein
MKLVLEIPPEAKQQVKEKEKFTYLTDDAFEHLIRLTLKSEFSELIKVRKARI